LKHNTAAAGANGTKTIAVADGCSPLWILVAATAVAKANSDIPIAGLRRNGSR
jgi:hypothetical protein